MARSSAERSTRWLRRGLSITLFLLVLDYLVLPQVAGTEKALKLLGSANGWLLALGVVLEAASLVSYSLLTRSLLPGSPARFFWVFRSDLCGLGVSHVIPGGAATGNTVRYRLLREAGATPEDLAVGVALEAVLSTVTLAAVLWVALVSSLPFYGPSPGYVTAAVLGALLLAGAGLAVLGHGREEAVAPAVAQRVIRHLPKRVQPRLRHALALAGAQVRELLSSPRGLRAATAWAVGNWLFDAGSLWAILAAFGHRAHPLGLLVAYCIASLVGMLPVTPGGLGLVEGLLIPSVAALGAPRATAVLGVVSWRLFEYWAPIPVAGLAFASLRIQRSIAQRRRRYPRR